MKPRALTPSQIQDAAAMWSAGRDTRAIAVLMHVSEAALWRDMCRIRQAASGQRMERSA
jgi:hypothetical protein